MTGVQLPTLPTDSRAMLIDSSIARRMRLAMCEHGLYPDTLGQPSLSADRALFPHLLDLLNDADVLALIRCAALFYATPAGQDVQIDAWLRARAYMAASEATRP